MDDKILNRLNVLVKKSYYTYERYDAEATFALLYHKEPISVVELSKFIRISDHLIELDEHHYFIIFAFTSQENAHKASQNIIHKLDSYLGSASDCFIALDALDITKTPQNVLNRLRQIVEQARKNGYVRVETEDVLFH